MVVAVLVVMFGHRGGRHHANNHNRRQDNENFLNHISSPQLRANKSVVL
jgi:hypothetical protein